jgi:type IV pilus assembly protein PilV
MPVIKQRGVSLIEALIALLVLSVGMLGIAGLYVTSVKANRSALNRTYAAELVNSMADRIRSNRLGVGNYAAARASAPTAPTRDCMVLACSPADMATFDKHRWYQSVVEQMPRGPDNSLPEIEIRYTARPNWWEADTFVVLLAWKEPGDTNFLTSQVEVLLNGEDLGP